MADKRKFSEEPNDAQIEQLLKTAYTAAEPPPAFADALYTKLDRQFTEQNAAALQEGYLAASTNGEAQASGAATLGQGLPAAEKAAARSTTWRTKRRLAVLVAVAASLLVAAALWSSRPVYGWARMMQALEECNWVQAVSIGADAKKSGWISAVRGIVAVQAGDRATFRDHRRQISSDYRPDERIVYRSTLAAARSWNWQADLLRLLAPSLAKESTLADLPEKLSLAAESWQWVTSQEDGRRLVELRVTLKTLEAASRLVKLVLLLDPQTNLPVACRVLGQEHRDLAAYRFAYPRQGPSSIFSLAVPRDARVVAADRATENAEPASAKAVPAEAEPLALDELVQRVDAQLAAYWQSQGIHPAEPASDAEFLRRVYLDLTGRIPTVSEARQFLEDRGADRRERLVDALLDCRDHATHLAAVWRTMLLPEGVDLSRLGGTAKFDTWLADRFDENLPYDQLVRQLLLAEGRISKSGPLLFYAAMTLNPEKLAARTSRVFLGMRMGCAQCHDHPFDKAISQQDFWGFAAFFAQISRPRGKMEQTSPVMRVHDNGRGEVTLPDTDEIVPPKLPTTHPAIATGADAPSRRQQLVDWLTSPENRRFSQAAVNRVWAHLFGRGLVEPVDDMRTDNPPVCPEVLETLSRDFVASRFDLRRLFKALALSRAYQLSSRSTGDDPSQALCFARMNIKSLTADQLYDCIAVATRSEVFSSSGDGSEGTLARLDNSLRQAFIEQFRAPPGQRTDYEAGIPQALSLMHGRLVHGATDLASSGLLKSLGAPFFSDQQRVETLFLATLSRLPEPYERQPMLEHIQAAANERERQRRLGDVLWALLNSAEFTLNH